jgi:16S rRNA (cytidine1402-2'-O)-methyltransferase
MASVFRKPALYLVGTPIGNLEDITLRALEVLKQVDVIACEDTRQTQKLLNHYGIEKKTISYHQHNELTRAAELIMQMEQGQAIAVVTDAGMPGISDPGYRLTVLAVRHKIPVYPIPGASAFLSALVASGLPTDHFHFDGFLPPKLSQRRAVLESIKESTVTEIFYEAPHRLLDALADVVDLLGGHRRVVVARELTKIHEEFLRGTAAEVLEQLKKRPEILGEIVLLVGRHEEQAATPVVAKKNFRTRVRELMKNEQLDEREAMKRVAKEAGVSKSEIYRELQKGKK